MLTLLGYLAGIIGLLAYVPYIRDIFLLKTKPERATWFIWAILGSMTFFPQVVKGATYSLWFGGVEALIGIIIFLLSLPFGVGGFAKKDYIALFVAACGLVLWFVTKEAAIALYIAIGIDAAGAILTIEKAYKDPKSETLSAWVLSSIAGILAAYSVGSFNIILLSYPLYIFGINAIVVIAIKLGLQKYRKK